MEQVARAVDVRGLQWAGLTRSQRRLVGQHRDDVAAVPHGHGFDVESGGTELTLDGRPADRARPESRGDDRDVVGLRESPDGVGEKDGRRGVGPHLRDTDHLCVVALYPHQVIGERQIGEQLPLADHGMQVVDGIAGQDSVLGEQITEGRHGLLRRRAVSWRRR